MLLITAALTEELLIGLELCRDRKKLNCKGVSLFRAARGDRSVCFLKTGVGPKNASAKLCTVLEVLTPSKIIGIGYAGALDETLTLGSLVVIDKAGFIYQDGGPVSPPEYVALPLAEELLRSAESAAAEVRLGNALTSRCIIGDPRQKKVLFERLGASIVDMETAALARTASAAGIPFGSVRSISDVAEDEFLAPFSYDPSVTVISRAMKIASAGHWFQRYGAWRERAAIARASLRRFLSGYLSVS